MKRLNPIYILALVITLFIISITVSSSKKDEFKSLNSEYSSFRTKVGDFKEYKQTWFDEKKIVKKIDTILRSPIFMKEKILKTQNNSIVRVKIESSNSQTLGKFLNRFLNERFIIKKLDVQKSSILVEIGLN